MTKILLISANVTKEPFPVYPLGMSTVAHDLRSRGYEAVEWDYLAQDESEEKLLEFARSQSPHFVGLSLRNIDNCNSKHTAYYCDLYRQLADSLRKITNAVIVLGGPGYSLFPQVLLEKIGADYGIEGEGEGVFADLIQLIESGKKPEQKVLRSTSPLSGEMISSPERDDETANYYIAHGGMLNIQTKRGCPFRCAYCTYPVLEGKFYRYRPATKVVDEIEMLTEKHDLKYYFIADSVFNDADKRYLAIAEELVKRKITIPWMAYFKPDRFQSREVALLKEAGLKAVEWGTDCASDRTLKGMCKNFTWSEVEESNRLFSDAGIASAHFIIFGGPEETEETVEEGIANLARLEKCVVFAATGVRVLPGTPMHKRAIDEKALSPEEDVLKPFFYFSPHTTREYLHERLIRAFEGKTDRVYPMGEDTDRVNAFHKLGYKGPIWDLLLGRRESRRKRSSP
ncbi:MAG: cobalamin-dependent protein [Deltaproteobacteria bacterium]|nr:cobalamin-dependent protein [Deltaproteobacteria bacterium]